MKCKEINIVAASELLIVRCTAERRDIFHIHSLIIDSDVEFVHKIYLSHEFNEFKSHQQSDFIEEVLNENYFKNFIIKVVIFDNNAQKLSVIFLKTVILLFINLQFELSFYN